jgi:ABC-type multidrug transport system ATPase subunit
MIKNNVIEIENVSFAFGEKMIIKNFSAQIKSGEHICLMGESGAGKTTLLNSIVGLTSPTNGVIKIFDLELNRSNIKQIRSSIAWLPQEINLPYQFANEVIENIFSLKVNKNLVFSEEKLFELFAKVGLEKTIYKQPMQKLSGGERQRFMLVVSLLLEKKILLLDEPTSALDANTRDKLLDFLKTLTNTTILTISHDEQVAKSFDRTFFLDKQS